MNVQTDVDTEVVVEPIKKPHVSHNKGNNEWYTPQTFIDCAVKVLGKIDLDPASSEVANMRVKALQFYSKSDDGLVQEWKGNVWMNPPYASGLIGKFCNKLIAEYKAGNVSSAIVLVNNATETGWFKSLIQETSAVCFPHGRVRFLDPDGNLGAPLQGQAVLYLGEDRELFSTTFSEVGWCAHVC